MDRALIERIVAEVMRRLSGESPDRPQQEAIPLSLVSEETVEAASKRGVREIRVLENHTVTPLAQDALRTTGIVLTVDEGQTSSLRENNQSIGFGSDGRGQALVEVVKRSLSGRDVVDLGRSEGFVEIARDVAQAVASGRCGMGIILGCGGDASALVANKVHGVRAVSCHDATSAKFARAHLDSNVLCIGVGVVGDTTTEEIIEIWLTTPFDAQGYGSYITQIARLENEGPPS